MTLISAGFVFNFILIILRVSSEDYDLVQIPEYDRSYIVNTLTMKYAMTHDDAKNCVTELEYFYTGLKYKAIDNMSDHPPSAIRNAWEIHIVYTSIYFDFTYSKFGTYIHHKPMEQDKGQLYLYHKLKNFGIKNMNETIWLLEIAQQQGEYSESTSWNNYYKESENLPNFNGKVNRFLEKFIKQCNPPMHNFEILDIAMGQGRNSLWLAQEGYSVTGFDTSSEGIRTAKTQAEKLNLNTLQLHVKSVEEFDFGSEQWDLIICMYSPIINETNYLRRIEQSLKRNGLLMIEGFHWDSLNGEHPIPIGVTYRTDAIPCLFPNLTTIKYEEPTDYSDFGNRQTKLIRYIGQRECPSTCTPAKKPNSP